MTITMVGQWVKQFEEGWTDVNNTEQTGQPSDSMTIENIQQLRDLLEEDCRTIMSELCFCLQAADYARTSVYKIVHDILGFRKLASHTKKVEWARSWNFCRRIGGRGHL